MVLPDWQCGKWEGLTMQSSTTSSHQGPLTSRFDKLIFATVIGFAAIAANSGPTLALSLGASASVDAVRAASRNNDLVKVRAVVRRGGGVRWARPSWYRWPVGGAIAAGAAIGFTTAAVAATWAGAAPTSGMCWYYTDASKTQGFWDDCPQ